ncbi:ABC-type polysaccharide/polyol phosphate transport system, ATPase component [Gulbenkiania indica]|uniref:ABC-type polysaccharide/polyol phosphate transport system, ATPase component n=1 Tax=Gulbenkiania indica TaxID=375574 RepID=A0A0K6H7E0_9NEIS|nr:ABC transporter ATP-binding protein [Gulbenkiania indica]CUA86643.1 ABC-type polysaccharide/polyol phosphate transport system, ATPase component [Gulbenkiania indica]
MSSEIAIKVENLSKCYQIYQQPRDRLKQFVLPRLQGIAGLPPKQYYREFWALKDVSFDVKKGESVGIVGRNGSGKSTLLEIITGTLAPTSGSTTTNGRIAALLELGSGFNPEFSGLENVYLNGALLGLTTAQIDAKFDAIAAFADIGDHLNQPVKTYSSGMYVRLAFAVQACLEPDILIVDEALAVGDEKFQRKCFDYIERLRSNGCSILLVTHATATVEKFCQRAMLLHHGKLHGFSAAKEIVDQYHALLYSDEKAYLRYLNQQTESRKPEQPLGVTPASDSALESHTVQRPSDDSAGLKVVITEWDTLDASGESVEVFRAGETARIRFLAEVIQPIKEIQAGILLRTVEGVAVFGTSSLYHGKNYSHPEAPSRLQFEFSIALDLCPGSYFVTLAIAEAITANDMNYLDRKTDVIVLKVNQPRILSTGIAALNSSVEITPV